MTLIPYPSDAAPSGKHPKPSRNLALDRIRTFLTLLVVIHHAVIAYTYFGHTDPKSFLGFDLIVLANDSFFMAMFFFLSGLFLWPSLARRVRWAFTRDRLLRLGIPFALAALTVIPLAYYAIALRHQTDLTFAQFWWKTITVGPWPSGPVWFVWVLFVLDFTGAVLFRTVPRVIDPLSRLSLRGFADPLRFFLVFVAITLIAHVPLRLYFGPNTWFEFGPFSVQTSRMLLYAAYFFVGAGIGAAGLSRGLLAPDGRLANGRWWLWAALALIPYALLWVLIVIKRGLLDNPDVLPVWYEACYGVLFVTFSAATTFTILAVFLRFMRDGHSLLDPLHADAYGIFLVHYVFVLWLQYALFDVDLPAVVKAPIVLVLALALSWASTALLRKIPGAHRVL
jgi:surface polysaccharide O-acyltransferase-like enzyme